MTPRLQSIWIYLISKFGTPVFIKHHHTKQFAVVICCIDTVYCYNFCCYTTAYVHYCQPGLLHRSWWGFASWMSDLREHSSWKIPTGNSEVLTWNGRHHNKPIAVLSRTFKKTSETLLLVLTSSPPIPAPTWRFCPSGATHHSLTPSEFTGEMSSTVTRYQSHGAPLGCGGTGDSHQWSEISEDWLR